jgi:type II secretory pathway pseudopilin PulG
MSRIALTLLEVIISIALFATLMVAVIESTISTQSYFNFHERVDDLESEGRTILRQISSDLSNSTWFNSNELPVVKKETLPFKDLNGVERNYRVDQLMFLKLRTERSVDPDPNTLRVERVSFKDAPTPLDQYATAPAIYSLVLNDAFINGNDNFVSAVWEAKDAGLSFADNSTRDKLRHFRYMIGVNPSTGLGELRRQYVNGLPDSSQWWQSTNWLPTFADTDATARWGSHIVSLEFTTWDDVDTNGKRLVNRNQIGVKLVLQSYGSNRSASTTREFSTTIAMRSLN